MALEVWEVDPAHSSLNFSIQHLLISRVRGRFSEWRGTLKIDEQYPENSSVELHIQADSIDTHNPERDAHLQSEDFLDVENYPKIVFQSKRVEKTDPDHLRVIGDLQIHGMTREVAVEAVLTGRAVDPWGKHRMGLQATASLDRRDFGIDWNQPLEGGGLLVGNEVILTAEIEAVRQAETAAA